MRKISCLMNISCVFHRNYAPNGWWTRTTTSVAVSSGSSFRLSKFSGLGGSLWAWHVFLCADCSSQETKACFFPQRITRIMSGHISLPITRSQHSGIAHSLIGRRFSRSFTSSPCTTSKAPFRNCISSFSAIFMTNTFGTLRYAIASIEDSRSACVPDSSGYRKLTPVMWLWLNQVRQGSLL